MTAKTPTTVPASSSSKAQNAFAALRWILALVLLTAVTLKTFEYLDAPPAERFLTILLIVSHIWLAMWFISGLYHRALVIVSVIVFASFATYAAWTGWTGRDSCGCFGTVKISPWIILGVDIAAVVAMIALRPKNATPNSADGRAGGFAVAALVVSGSLAGYMFTRPAMTLSPGAQHAASQPAKPSLGKLSVDLGYVLPKSKHNVQFTLKNPSDQPMKITKIEKECKCTTLPETIAEIPPHSERTIDATFDAPDVKSNYSKRVVLSTDSKEFPSMVLNVNARIGLPLGVTPGKLNLASIPAGETREIPLTLTNEGEEPVQLLYTIATSPNVTVDTPRTTLTRGQSANLLAHVTADPATKNFIIRIHTDHAQQAMLEVIGQ